MRQILNPGGDKYDATRYGNTATIDPSSTQTGSASRNIGSGISPSTRSDTDNASNASIKSGVVGTPSHPTTDTLPADASTGNSHLGRDTALGGSHDPSRHHSDLPPQSTNTSSGLGRDVDPTSTTSGSGSHLGRDAALGGAGAAGLAGYEANKHHHGQDSTSNTLGSGSTTGTHGLTDRSVANPTSNYGSSDLNPTSGGYGNSATAGSSNPLSSS